MSNYYDPDEAKRLEKEALNYSRLAVEADKKNLKPLAINYYSRAIDALSRLIEREESQSLKQFYMKKIREYRYRLTYLRGEVVGKAGDGSIASFTASDTGGSVRDVEAPDSLHWLKPFKSSITWDDIVGLDDIKKVIVRSIAYPIRRPDLFPLGWPRAILLFGPPGCGKTSIAAAISNEIEAEFYPIDASMILSKWLGESEKRVAELFNFLRSKAMRGTPVILYIDEVDALIGARREEVGGEARTRSQFLKEMDGLNNKDNYKIPLFVIASTNVPWQIPEAFVRRFNKRIYVPPPDYESRVKLFRFYLSKVRYDEGIDFDTLAERTEGYSASDIRDVVQTAYLEVISEFFESGKVHEEGAVPRPLTMDDLLEALKRVQPSISMQSIVSFQNWNAKYGSG